MEMNRYLPHTIAGTPLFWVLGISVVVMLPLLSGFMLVAYIIVFFGCAGIVIMTCGSVRALFLGFLIIYSFYIVNLTTISNAHKIHAGEISGIVSSVDGTKVKLIFTRVHNSSIAAPLTVDLKDSNVSLNNLRPYDVLHLTITETRNMEQYRRNELIIRPDEGSNTEVYTTKIGQIIETVGKLLDTSSERYFGDDSALIKAMVLGVDDDLSSEESKKFQRLGIGHLLVASGANIIMILAAVEYLTNKLPRKFRLPIELVIVIFYIALIGFQGSIVRAFFFYCVNATERFVGREISFVQKCLMTVILTSIFFPGLVCGISFILSFVAAISIQFGSTIIEFFSLKNRFVKAAVLNTVIILTVDLYAASVFSRFNLNGIFANLILLSIAEGIVTVGFVFYVLVFMFGGLVYVSLARLMLDVLALVVRLFLWTFNYISATIDSVLGYSLNVRFRPDSLTVIILYAALCVVWIWLSNRLYTRKIELRTV